MLDKEIGLKILEAMLRARHGDLREQRLIRQGKGLFHVSGMGHEAMAACAFALKPGDYCFPFYRDRGFVEGRGIGTENLALSFYAKKTSSSAGRQLPGHYSSRALNIWSHPSPIASHLLPACGAAWGLQLDGKKDSVVIANVGDGGSRQGDFFEAVCFAKERNLPVIFVVEDNGVAISTRTQTTNALALKALREEDWKSIDGTSVEEIVSTVWPAIAKARKGGGPSFIWAKVERLSSHSSADDHRNYRSESELQGIQTRDPITRYRDYILAQGWLTQAQYESLDTRIEETTKAIYVQAELAPDPRAGDEMENVLGPLHLGPKPPIEGGKPVRMADALNTTFHWALKHNPDTCFFGEDVEDPLGGVFKLTKGLSGAFPGRVVNSPLAESSILGIASGLAAYGKRPIFEIQFIDFISPGWNQLVNNLANLRWRSFGDWTCPAIIYAPCGGYLPGGAIWHSQTNESVFAHYPGLIVLMPSTPEDASGMLLSALACNDPVLFLIPKHLLWKPQAVSTEVAPIPLGKAAIRRSGAGATVVSWGNCIELVEKVLESFPRAAEVELIDLRSIMPWDKETIRQSLAKTNRLVVVQEDGRHCSVGQSIISTLSEDLELWSALKAPPILVSKDNVHIGYNQIYEYSALPSEGRVHKALETVLSIAQTSRAAFNHPAPAHIAALATKEGSLYTLTLPNLGEGLLEARVIEIFKKAGDAVAQDEPLCEVETDKAVFPIESSVDGVLKEWCVEQDEVIQVGHKMAYIQTQVGQGEFSAIEEAAAEATTGKSTLTQGHDGALSVEIIQQLQGVLPARLGVVADWEHLRTVRAETRGRSDGGVFSYTTMVAWAVTQAMKEHPAFRRLLRNGRVTEPRDDFDVGFAVALAEDALETAVIKDANRLNWTEFVSAYRDALKSVQMGTMRSKAHTAILITSMAPLHIRSGTPIVVPPALGTLFLGEPYFEMQADKTAREVVSLDLSFDHRWANGAGAGQFLKKIKDNIERFAIE